jgi:hypothetical protein
MKAKLNQDMPAYLILGDCNPQLAHTALGIDPFIGLLLPATVVRRLDNTRAVVDPLDPAVMVTATLVPSVARAHAWCSDLPTSSPQNTSYLVVSSLSDSDN